MERIKSALAIVSLIAQAFGFLGFGFLVVDLFGLTYIMTPEMEEDLSLLVPFITETLVSYQSVGVIGVIGAVVAYIIYFKGNYRALWFLRSLRVAGWLWLPLVPIGTIIGVAFLGAYRSARDSESAE